MHLSPFHQGRQETPQDLLNSIASQMKIQGIKYTYFKNYRITTALCCGMRMFKHTGNRNNELNLSLKKKYKENSRIEILRETVHMLEIIMTILFFTEIFIKQLDYD